MAPSTELKCWLVSQVQEGGDVLTGAVRVSDELPSGEGYNPAVSESTIAIRPGVFKQKYTSHVAAWGSVATTW